jgi:hypothetical protein
MKNIILLSPGPFSKRDYDRFGIEFLKKNFSVKILDFTKWIHPDFWEIHSKNVYKCKECIIISCKNDFLEFNSHLGSVIVIDCLQQNRKTNWAKKQLRKKNSLFVRLDINLYKFEKVNVFRFLKKLINLIITPKKFLYSLFRFFEQNYYNGIKKTHPSDILVLGGLVSSDKSKFKNKIYAHCMDYDVYLDIKNKPKNNVSPYAVFLDEDMITHPDYSYLNYEVPVSEFQYYSILIKFLKKFETETGLQIKFAIHPKSCNTNLPNLLKDFDYSKGNTAELVKNSSAVLLHSSTSISYAILFKKPTIFLTSNELIKSWIRPRIDNFVKMTNSKLINMSEDLNKQLDLQSLLEINEVKYKNYLEQYLKVPNSPDIPLWEIFTKYIKSKQFEK